MEKPRIPRSGASLFLSAAKRGARHLDPGFWPRCDARLHCAAANVRLTFPFDERGPPTVRAKEEMRMRVVSPRRSLAKAITYRILIMCLDFLTIYLLTGAVHVAIGFMIISNIYTSLAYLLHERLWARVQWGIAEG
jgi:uncharacterized membrane protein